MWGSLACRRSAPNRRITKRRAFRPDHLHPKEGAGLLHHLPQVEGQNFRSRGDERGRAGSRMGECAGRRFLQLISACYSWDVVFRNDRRR